MPAWRPQLFRVNFPSWGDPPSRHEPSCARAQMSSVGPWFAVAQVVEYFRGATWPTEAVLGVEGHDFENKRQGQLLLVMAGPGLRQNAAEDDRYFWWQFHSGEAEERGLFRMAMAPQERGWTWVGRYVTCACKRRILVAAGAPTSTRGSLGPARASPPKFEERLGASLAETLTPPEPVAAAGRPAPMALGRRARRTEGGKNTLAGGAARTARERGPRPARAHAPLTPLSVVPARVARRSGAAARARKRTPGGTARSAHPSRGAARAAAGAGAARPSPGGQRARPLRRVAAGGPRPECGDNRAGCNIT